MNIVGYAQNIEDGSVHIVAEGDKNVLGQFLREIKKGNKYSKVEKVVTYWGVASDDFDGFNIA
jgi:acylphosphatase